MDHFKCFHCNSETYLAVTNALAHKNYYFIFRLSIMEQGDPPPNSSLQDFYEVFPLGDNVTHRVFICQALKIRYSEVSTEPRH